MRTLFPVSLLTFLMLAVLSGNAQAGDNIQLNVSEVETLEPYQLILIKENGAMEGTIQLFYLVQATQFSAGDVGTFSIEMDNVHLSGPGGNYPTELTFTQIGSEDLTLEPAPDTFGVAGLGPVGSTTVLITIPADISGEDELVANLRVSTPGRANVKTPTNIQVHLNLVPPAVQCLHVFNFITDLDFENVYTSMSVNVNSNKQEVSSTSPSQVSDNVLVANQCGWDETFDLGIVLDSRFQTNPNGNPGNAIHAYDSNGIEDDDPFDFTAFGNEVGMGQNLCIENVTVPAGASYLATVHSQVAPKLAVALLADSPFHFQAWLTAPDTTCAGANNVWAIPDPHLLDIPFSVTETGAGPNNAK